MSKKDDDFVTFLAWCWLLDRDDKELEEIGSGIGWTVLLVIFAIMHANRHPIAITVEVALFVWLIWKYGKRISKFLIYSAFSLFVSLTVGSTILLLVKISIGFKNMQLMDIIFVAIGYIGSFLYSYCVTCPWITQKAREIVRRN